MTYTEQTLVAERFALLNGEDRRDVLAWLTSPYLGTTDEEDDNA